MDKGYFLMQVLRFTPTSSICLNPNGMISFCTFLSLTVESEFFFLTLHFFILVTFFILFDMLYHSCLDGSIFPLHNADSQYTVLRDATIRNN